MRLLADDCSLWILIASHRMSFGWALTYLLPGEDHNEQRKVFHQVIGPRTIPAFDTMLEEGAADFCKALKGFSGDPNEIASQ